MGNHRPVLPQFGGSCGRLRGMVCNSEQEWLSWNDRPWHLWELPLYWAWALKGRKRPSESRHLVASQVHYKSGLIWVINHVEFLIVLPQLITDAWKGSLEIRNGGLEWITGKVDRVSCSRINTTKIPVLKLLGKANAVASFKVRSTQRASNVTTLNHFKILKLRQT